MGFLAAIPVGASQLEVARRSLRGLLPAALIVTAGSVSSDFVYGAIALYGLAPFLQHPEVEAIFWLVNAALILFFAITTLRESKTSVPKLSSASGEELERPQDSKLRLANKRVAYLTGFSLSFTNPMMIAWWLLAARFLKDLGVAVELTGTMRIFFLLAGCLGIGSYLTLFAIVIFRRHHVLSPKHIRRITRGFGYVMILFAAYFIIRSIAMLVAPQSAGSTILGNLQTPSGSQSRTTATRVVFVI
jgi:threonine/homoserine/homoserine lactone efflux protein